MPTLNQVLTLIDNDLAEAPGFFGNYAEGNFVTVGAFKGKLSYAGGTNNDVTLTVVANVSIAANDASGSETGPDNGQFTVTFCLGTAFSVPAGGLLVNFNQTGSTATDGADFTSIGTSVTISSCRVELDDHQRRGD